MKLLKVTVPSTFDALGGLPDISHLYRALDCPIIPVTQLPAPSRCVRYLIQLQWS